MESVSREAEAIGYHSETSKDDVAEQLKSLGAQALL